MLCYKVDILFPQRNIFFLGNQPFLFFGVLTTLQILFHGIYFIIFLIVHHFEIIRGNIIPNIILVLDFSICKLISKLLYNFVLYLKIFIICVFSLYIYNNDIDKNWVKIVSFLNKKHY